jgi:hypothetical protein
MPFAPTCKYLDVHFTELLNFEQKILTFSNLSVWMNSRRPAECRGEEVESIFEWVLDKLLDPRGFLASAGAAIALLLLYTRTNPITLVVRILFAFKKPLIVQSAC